MLAFHALIHALNFRAYDVVSRFAGPTFASPLARLANQLWDRISTEVGCDTCGLVLGETTQFNPPAALCIRCS
jgi:hypothetical protein